MRYNLKSVKIVLFCTTNTTTNANEIKALTRVESENNCELPYSATERCLGQHSALSQRCPRQGIINKQISL